MQVYFPPNAVVEPVDISCTVVPETTCASLPVRGEILVTNIVRMEPENMKFREAAIVSLMHCSSRQTFGYENVVKVLDTVSQTWKEQTSLAELEYPAGTFSICLCMLISCSKSLENVSKLYIDYMLFSSGIS